MANDQFHLFPNLPYELRHQIWNEALSEDDEPALFPYKKGCWQPRWLSESDVDYDARCEHNVNLEYHYDHLDHIEMEIPLAQVNREARSIALAWARGRGFDKHRSQEHGSHAFMRSFDPDRDALYVAAEQLHDFSVEPYDRLFEPDLVNKNVSCTPVIRHIAVPESLIKGDQPTLDGEELDWYIVSTLFIIDDAYAHVKSSDTKSRRRFNLSDGGQKALVWNREAKLFSWGTGESVRGDDVYRSLEVYGEKLVTWLKNQHFRSFELKPV